MMSVGTGVCKYHPDLSVETTDLIIPVDLYSTSFLILDVCTVYCMLLSRQARDKGRKRNHDELSLRATL